MRITATHNESLGHGHGRQVAWGPPVDHLISVKVRATEGYSVEVSVLEVAVSITARLVDAIPLPMIYVRFRTSLQDAAIAGEVGKAFGKLGQFMATTQIRPIAPPLAVYSDWNKQLVTVDVGFPVAEFELGKVTGEIHAGRTPAGPAMKAIHHGSFDEIKETYGVLQRAIESKGEHVGGVMWEIYFNDPATTPPKDLVTEVYMRLADAPAATAAQRS